MQPMGDMTLEAIEACVAEGYSKITIDRARDGTYSAVIYGERRGDYWGSMDGSPHMSPAAALLACLGAYRRGKAL